MKITVLDWGTISQNDVSCDFLNKYGETKIYDLTAPEEIPSRICESDIVICNKCVLDESNLKYAKNLKCICLFATGYNNVDINYARSRNIAVCNVPDYSRDSVAQHTFALILEIFNRACDYNLSVQQGDWKRCTKFSYFHLPIHELSGKILGIAGFGSIGKRVAEIAAAFGMKVIAYTRTPKQDENVTFVTFDELLEKSDIITLHCPLTAENSQMMNKAAFSKMKNTAVFINTARGGLVDEIALREALINNTIFAAAVDVLTTEPMDKNCPLYDIPNLIITPHIAWAAIETRRRLMEITDKNIECFLKGSPQNNVAKGKAN